MSSFPQPLPPAAPVPLPSGPALPIRDFGPRPRAFLAFQCVFWIVMTMLSVGMSHGFSSESPIRWLSIAVRMGSGFLITAGVYWLFELPRVRGLSRLVRWPLMTLVTVGALVGSLMVMMSFHVDTYMVWTSGGVLAQLVPRIAVGIFWCTACFAVELFDGLYVTELRLAQAEADSARREAVALEHEVHRLQAQMNPHFLFNALNAVVACKDSPEDVARLTQDLADFLHSALRDSRPLEPLSREIQTLEKYLAVQQARFGTKLDGRIMCDRAARNVMVPPMMIQPLLENAIAYGMQTSEGRLRVEVSARVAAGWLEVTVANSGAWIAPDAARSPGTGLKTLRKRLALLIGPAADVLIDQPGPHPRAGDWPGVRVMIRMPAAMANDEGSSQGVPLRSDHALPQESLA